MWARSCHRHGGRARPHPAPTQRGFCTALLEPKNAAKTPLIPALSTAPAAQVLREREGTEHSGPPGKIPLDIGLHRPSHATPGKAEGSYVGTRARFGVSIRGMPAGVRRCQPELYLGRPGLTQRGLKLPNN